MGLPKKLKNFALFVDGVSYVGETEEITLPKLTRKMEKFRSGGMAGEIELDLGAEAVDSLEIVVRGRHKEFDPGKAKGGDKTELTIKSAISYYKLTVNGTALIEIDVVNMIELVNGVDRMQQVRAALGI